MITGYTPIPNAWASTVANRAYLIGANLVPSRLSELGAYLDGGGGGFSPDDVRPVVWRTSDGKLMAVGDPVTVAPEQAAGWVHMPFGDDLGKQLDSDHYAIGFVCRVGGTIRRASEAVVINRHTNPSAEVDLTGFSADASSGGNTTVLARTTAAARSGKYGVSAHVWKTDGSAMTLNLTADGTSAIPVTAGQNVAARAFVRKAGGQPVPSVPRIDKTTFRFRWLNGSGVLISEDNGVLTATGSYLLDPGQRVLANYSVAPAGAAFLRLMLQNGPFNAGGGIMDWAVDVDQIMVVRSATVITVPYFDGSMTGGLWDGAPHASESNGSAYATCNFSSPPATLGALTGAQARTPTYVSSSEEWPLPTVADETYYTTLGFYTVEEHFNGPRTELLPQTYDMGWHGTSMSEPGSIALVSSDGPLADLVGDWVRISYEQRSVAAYVYAEANVAETISVTRRLFAQLAPLALDDITVEVEVLA